MNFGWNEDVNIGVSSGNEIKGVFLHLVAQKISVIY
jgi:hypothetical protein